MSDGKTKAKSKSVRPRKEWTPSCIYPNGKIFHSIDVKQSNPFTAKKYERVKTCPCVVSKQRTEFGDLWTKFHLERERGCGFVCRVRECVRAPVICLAMYWAYSPNSGRFILSGACRCFGPQRSSVNHPLFLQLPAHGPYSELQLFTALFCSTRPISAARRITHEKGYGARGKNVGVGFLWDFV